jgi:hypothetical protein
MSFSAGRVGLVARGLSDGAFGRRVGAYNWRELSVVLAGMAGAVAVAAAITFEGPTVTVLAFALALLVAAVAVRPVIGAYLLIGVTPLVAGMSRGAAVPMLRPQEVVLVLVVAGLCCRAIVRVKANARVRLAVSRVDVAIVVLAVMSSVIPLAWMALRRQRIASDDVLYALMVWKYYAIFLVFRGVVRSPDEARKCLCLSLASAAVVAVVAILQASHHFGVDGFLGKYYGYSSSANITVASHSRGGSTLGLPIAVADLMVFNLAIAIGLLRSSARRWSLLALASLFVVAVFAAAEFSGVIGLVVGSVAIAVVTRRFRYIAVMPAALGPAALVVRTAVSTRLQGFQSTSGLPVSWEGRLHNLHTYFLPKLFAGDHWILGIRPAARVATSKMSIGYIWIESGYIWLLWAGGLPLLMSFFYFLWTAGREARAVFRARADAAGAAALAVLVALSVVGVLMITDPHLTYRGSADLLFALLGITAAARGMPRSVSERSKDGEVDTV